MKGGKMPEKNLSQYGITNTASISWNLSTPALYAEAIRNHEADIAHLGPLVVRTGHHTGRAPNDRFVVEEPTTSDKIWWGKENRPFSPDKFERLYLRVLAYLQGKKLYVQDCYSGADVKFRMPVRIINETAWHNMFVRNMFIRIQDSDILGDFEPKFTVIHAPHFHAYPELDGTNSDAFVVLNFQKKMVIIGGTSYAGEIKKSIFTAMNFYLPQKNVLTMHCSANMGRDGDTAIFFGLSGTGKTTVSTDSERKLIGDDEHGWSDEGVFNFEGGCYAMEITLSRQGAPDIYECTRKFGTILENVGFDSKTGRVDLDDNTLAENTRAAYPITHIENIVPDGRGGHAKNIIFLTADAFGVLPPVAKLTLEQAEKYFLIGYTAKLAGTEIGVTEPRAAFSACFGAPFMALNPSVYARLLIEKIRKHNVDCWLVNTGWINGPYGKGERISIKLTRAMVRAILDGTLAKAKFRTDKIFGLSIPERCAGVPPDLLDPANGWENEKIYQSEARKLADNFEKVYNGIIKNKKAENVPDFA